MLPEDWLKQIQAVYPRRKGGQGWGYVKRRVPELIKEGNDFEDLLAGAKSYGDYCKATGEEYVRMARTFFGPDEWWAEDYAVETFTPRRMPEPVSEDQLKRDREKAERELNAYMKVVK